MQFPKLLGIASGIALSSSLAFGWSISGVVKNTTGEPLQGVTVDGFNIASIHTVSGEGGVFSLSSDGTSALNGAASLQMSAQFFQGTLTLSNVNAGILKVSMIDAMGKILCQRTFQNAYGNITMDMSKYTAQGAKFIRINTDGRNSTYTVAGKAALLKEGETLLPTLQFALEGYVNTVYKMMQEVETNVLITMEKKSESIVTSSANITPASSNSMWPTKSSESKSESSATVAASSAQEVTIDCSGKAYQAGDHNMSVNVDGKNRTFIMHVPSQYKGDKPVPLVVDYHPIGGSGAGQMSDQGGTTYKRITDQEGVISLYPDGTGGKSMMGPGWNVGPCCSNDDDIKFSREMIKAVEEKVCIDTKRVYAAGFSMGGGMSNHVACNMADVFAAVAPAAMDLNTTNSATCSPARPISIIMFRGTNDQVCRYGGGDSGFNDGLNFLGAEGNFKFWADKNGCTGSPSKNSNGCNEYSNCKDGVKVVLCTKQGGQHEQGDGSIGWPFLKSFTLP